MASLQNPHGGLGSVARQRRMYYSINCAMCHGVLGDGNGTMKEAGYNFYPEHHQ
jgi:cytochrome c